ncbi:MAG: CRTAC1 family protein [Pirellula sp.]
MLFECTKTGQFADVARPLGCDAIEDSRGVAIADLNNDGRLDIVINNNNEVPAIYLNQLAGSGNWMRMILAAGENSNRDAIGASVQILLDKEGKECKLSRWVEAGTGYSAQSDTRLHFGLGDAEQIKLLRITWPDGCLEEYAGEKLRGRLNSTFRIEQGRGIVAPVGHSIADVTINDLGGAQR